tara:strand:- start:1200 stop:1406 length:207 start_codon:yes stop_codon:yes gene_type:complete
MIISNPQYYKIEIYNEKTNSWELSSDNYGIKATIDGVSMEIPLDPNNRHYEEILRQVKAGTLTIKDAD